jgi:hypothetical protein
MPVSKGTDKGEMRVNMRIVKSVAVDANGTLKELQLNVTGVIPVGAAQADIEACYQDELLVAAAATPIKTMMVSGDINLSD